MAYNEGRANALQAAARTLVLAAVLAAPWLFGAADPWAYLLICLLVGLGVAVWLVSLVGSPRPSLRAPLLAGALVLLVAFTFTQSAPLPRSLVRWLSPASERVSAAHAAAAEEAGLAEFLPATVQGVPVPATLSACPLATRRSCYLLTAYVGAFLVLANTLWERRQLRRTAGALVVCGFALAVFGLVQAFSGTRRIYWFHQPRFGGEVFGPFTNRNHFAAHMNMHFGVALGLLGALAYRARRMRRGSLRGGPGWLSTRSGARAVLTGFAAALMGTAVFVTLSRGAMVGLVIALALVGVLALVGGIVPGRGRAVAFVALLILLGVAWLGWRPVVERLGSLAEVAHHPWHEARTRATLDTFEVFRSWPLTGCGFGAFRHVFPAFQDPAIQTGRWLHAHNDYVQLLAEGGLLGAGLTALASVGFLIAFCRRLLRATTEGRCMAAGLAVSIVAVAVHSVFDYSLHKPANALLLSAIGGMALATLCRRSDEEETRRRRSRRERSKPRTHEAIGAGAGR
jgi:O-antigen ligase